MVSVQKKSEAQVHQLPPPQRAAIAAGLDKDEQRLMKAEKSASLHRGILLGLAPGIVFGVLLALIATTTLFDPIAKVTFTNAIARNIAEESR